MEDIHALSIDPLARVNWINGTSNTEYSDWMLYTHFSIKDDQPVARFEVLDEYLSKNPPLFKTNSYQELEKWIELHREEIQKQLEKKLKK